MLQSKSTETSSSLKAQNTMEGLSDSDLKTLLQNFKDLSTDEQHGLITYLKKLEAREPDRVERLRKFVKLGPNMPESSEKAYTSGRMSPFSNREAGANPTIEDIDKNKGQKAPQKIIKLNIDSDEDDDYSFEDVFRAASKNVKEKQLQEERTKMLDNPKSDKTKDMGINFNDAKMLIANLMGQLGNKNNSGLNLLGLGSAITSNSISVGTNSVTTAANLAPVQLANQPLNPDANSASTLLNNTKITHVNPNPPIKQADNPASYPTNPNNPPQNYPYGYQNRNYNPNYDPNYGQNYHTNPNIAPGYNNQANVSEYGYGADQYNSSYPAQGMAPQVRPQFNRSGQYPYDPRQNYY